MNIYRIYGIILRFLFLFKHNFNRLADTFYWPVIDLLLWGLTSYYFKTQLPGTSQITLVIVSGILLWLIVWRGQYEITVNLLEEKWNKNLINIFGSPLKFSEWIVSLITLGLIKAVISFTFAAFVAYVFYKVKIFVYGFYLIPFAALLIMTGWWAGFFIAGLILRFGTKVEAFAWTAIMVISPFSAIYYPLSILPPWAQKVALIVPTSYIFEGAREVIYRGTLDINKLLISFLLNLIYLLLSLIFIWRSFKTVLNEGLEKIH